MSNKAVTLVITLLLMILVLSLASLLYIFVTNMLLVTKRRASIAPLGTMDIVGASYVGVKQNKLTLFVRIV